MLSKEDQKQKNQEFWEGYKQFMRGISSSNGRRMNWINYPTDVKDLYVRLEVSHDGCSVNFDIQPKDSSIREIIWEQMGELKVVLEKTMNYDTFWDERHFGPTNMESSRISWKNEELNYFKEEDIPKIYAFLKARLLSFDEFYQEYKDILIALTD